MEFYGDVKISATLPVSVCGSSCREGTLMGTAGKPATGGGREAVRAVRAVIVNKRRHTCKTRLTAREDLS